MTLPAAFPPAFRRTTQLVRAYRRHDVPAMNAVLAEAETDGRSASEVLMVLIGLVSDLLDRLPFGDVDELLSDLVIDFARDERER